MGPSAFSPATKQHVARQPACAPARLTTPVVNMGLEEIQKQAKAS